MTQLTLIENWKEVGQVGHFVMYIQATITSVYAHRVTIVDDNGRTVEGSSQGVKREDFGKQFLNYKHQVESKNEHIFTVTIKYSPDDKNWYESSYKVSDSLNIADRGIFGIVLSNDSGGDLDYNDCVVIISLYKESFD